MVWSWRMSVLVSCLWIFTLRSKTELYTKFRYIYVLHSRLSRKNKKNMWPLWGFEWKFRYIFYPIFWTDHQTLSVCGHRMDDATIKLKPYKAIALIRPGFGLILAQFIKLSKKKSWNHIYVYIDKQLFT